MFLAHIELTNACNFRCLHCYANKYGNEYIDETDLKTASSVSATHHGNQICAEARYSC